MKVLLANDTAAVGHVGCRAVADAHARLLGRAGHEIVRRFYLGELAGHADAGDDAAVIDSLSRDPRVIEAVERADAIVVNGEGTIHHGKGRDLLGLLGLGQRLGKTTILANAVFQDMPGFDDVLKKLDDLCLRDGRSGAYLRDRGIAGRVVADSYYAARFAPAADDDLAGRVVVTDRHWQREADVGAALDAFVAEREDATVVPLHREPGPPRDWRRFPAELGRARAVVTARHHGLCAAILAGRPVVALGSNTWKIEGEMDDLGLGDLFVGAAEDIGPALARAEAEPERFEAARERVLADGGPDPFRVLGSGGPSREEDEVRALVDDLAARGVTF